MNSSLTRLSMGALLLGPTSHQGGPQSGAVKKSGLFKRPQLGKRVPALVTSCARASVIGWSNAHAACFHGNDGAPGQFITI